MYCLKHKRIKNLVGVLSVSTALVWATVVSHASAETLDELVAAAKKEGTVNFYSAYPVPATQVLTDAFEDKYGITVEALALPGGTLLQRFASELQGNSFNADVILGAGFEGVVTKDYVPKGWMVPIQSVGLPELDGNKFPAQFLNKNTATIGYAPFFVAYNTDKVSKADVPKSYADLADPKYLNKVCLADPAVADVYIELWDRIRDKLGEKVLTGIAANKPKIFSAAAATAAALAAGECDIAAPISAGGIMALPKQAPVATVLPEVATGAEMQLGTLDPKKIRHPNAAKLFANYLLTPEGNKAASAGKHVWVLDPAMTPEQIKALKASPDAITRKAEILKLLGR